MLAPTLPDILLIKTNHLRDTPPSSLSCIQILPSFSRFDTSKVDITKLNESSAHSIWQYTKKKAKKKNLPSFTFTWVCLLWLGRAAQSNNSKAQ